MSFWVTNSKNLSKYFFPLKVKKKIEGLGGKVENKVDKETTALLSDPETVKEERSKVRKSIAN